MSSDKETRSRYLKSLTSLCVAIEQAGGSVTFIETLEEMTFFEALERLAQNNIRFEYRP